MEYLHVHWRVKSSRYQFTAQKSKTARKTRREETKERLGRLCPGCRRYSPLCMAQALPTEPDWTWLPVETYYAEILNKKKWPSTSPQNCEVLVWLTVHGAQRKDLALLPIGIQMSESSSSPAGFQALRFTKIQAALSIRNETTWTFCS